MSDTLTAEECGVMKWCEKPHDVSIFFKASSGPNVLCTFISYSETFLELHELARKSFIEAFILKEYVKDQNELGIITVTTHGYGDQYHCFFKDKRDVPEHIECRILTSDDWHRSSSFDKIIKWACELETHINNIIKEYKVHFTPFK